MKFTIKRGELQRELTFLQGVVEKKNTIPVLSNLLVEANGHVKMVGTDLDATLTTEAEAQIERTGSCMVAAGKLISIAKTLPPAADVTFESLENGHVRLTCERATFRLPGTDVKEFPEVPRFKEGSARIPSEVFRTMIGRTIFSITQEESRYALAGAKFEMGKKGARMVTTDGHRLSFVESAALKSKEGVDVLIPRKVLAEVAKLAAAHDGEIQFSTDDNHVYFQVGTRTLVARLLTGQFPIYEMVMPKDNNLTAELESAPLALALKRVAVMADDRSRAVRLQFTPGTLRISTNSAEEGEAHEELPMEYDGGDLEIGFNCGYLLDVLNNTESERVKIALKDGKSQVEITPVGAELVERFIVMPMSI